jgi:hypothetical protein
MGAETAKDAWSRLAGLSALDGIQVIVDAESPLAPRGWIGSLAVDDTVTASVPRPDLERPVAAALAGLTSREASSPDTVVRRRLPPTRERLGPALLFCPPSGLDMTIARLTEAGRAGLTQELGELAAAIEALGDDGST